ASIARSLYTQQRIVGVFPGTMVFGISSTFSRSVSFHACLATSLNRCSENVSRKLLEGFQLAHYLFTSFS
ncbi:MAG: hypothetical protein IIU38_07715, partial [Bacteroidaceae bacterium]|nr:hypothetical protein [Bacteroidaceae bacterium]